MSDELQKRIDSWLGPPHAARPVDPDGWQARQDADLDRRLARVRRELHPEQEPRPEPPPPLTKWSRWTAFVRSEA